MARKEQTVVLISNNEERFEVPLKVAQISSFVKDVLAEDCEYDEGADRNVYCLKVSGLILKKVVEFCTHYASDPMSKIVTPLTCDSLAGAIKQEWYTNFCNVDRKILFALVSAANYMNIKPLLDLACLTVSFAIKGEPFKELLHIFHLSETPHTPVEDNGRNLRKNCEDTRKEGENKDKNCCSQERKRRCSDEGNSTGRR